MDEQQDREFDFWQDHSDRFLEMAFRHDRSERIAHPDGYGKKTGDCGDTVTFYLVVEKSRIRRISYELQGCIHTNACANAISERAEGKTVSEAWGITPDDISEFLGTLPAEKYHCAELAMGAFYLALANCRELARDPWKKAYSP
jgi:nitrogen fixation NifU-like protein